MQIDELFGKLQQIEPNLQNQVAALEIADGLALQIYPNSIQLIEDECYFIAREAGKKYLWVASCVDNDFEGESRFSFENGVLLQCPLNHHNADLIRARFDFTRPVLIGLADSFGYGDRLGIANPAHIRVGKNFSMKPILAQQSIRELQRTQRKPEEVMDAATWAVLQEGYRDGFGADADHLKTSDDIDLMVRAGFTMFTIDPGEYVVNEADSLPIAEIEKRLQSILWELLEDGPDEFVGRYARKSLAIGADFVIEPQREQILRGLLKYGNVIVHTTKLYRYLKNTYPHHPSEVELSVDETESVTSPFEHFLVANELKRRDVKLISLAPRFVGDFEKGIDYKGDIEQFKTEYVKHVQIAEQLGPYKISIHSGSDKFTVYEAIGALKQGHVHVKTAGTSYLEALRTVAATEPDLFREILDFARGLYDSEKKTYHVSADLKKVAAAEKYNDEQLLQLFDQNDSRQVLHVTFGKVLTTRNNDGAYLFRDRLLDCLKKNEETHYQYLMKHFNRHLKPFV